MTLPFILHAFSGWWSFLFGNILLLLLMRFRYPMKKTVPIGLLLVPLAVFALWIYYVFGSETGGQVFLLINTIPSFFLCFYLSKYRDSRFLFTFFFTKTVSLAIVLFSNLADAFFTPESHALLALLRFALYSAVLFVLVRFLRDGYLLVQEKLLSGWFLFGILSALFYITLHLSFNFPSTLSKRPFYIPVFCLFFTVGILAYVTIFQMIYQTITIYEARERENLLAIETASLMMRLKEFEDKNETIAIYRHDERHRLQQLLAILKEGRTGDAVAFLGQTETLLSETAIRRFCSDPTINAILSFYAEAASREGIPFYCEAAASGQEPSVPEMLLPSTALQAANGNEMFPIVIANALENALHANQRFADKTKCFIRVVLISKPERMLRVENPLPDGTMFDAEGFPTANEKDAKGNHGIGIKSIRAFAKKQNADLYYRKGEHDGIQTISMTMIG